MKTTQDWILAFGMLTTGSINTLSVSWADKIVPTGQELTHVAYRNCGPNLNPEHPCTFNHPFFQTLFMFCGEVTCLLFFKLRQAKRRCSQEAHKPPVEFNPLIFFLPACCDMTGTSCMYLGLTLTAPSVFQMLRGSVIVFTAVLSVVFLKRKLTCTHWTGIGMVVAGTLLVGAASIVYKDKSSGPPPSNPLLGNILIIAAQVIVAIQMVLEEKFVNAQNIPPLQAVGWEGVFGVFGFSLLLIIMYHLPGLKGISNSPDHMEDTLTGIKEFAGSWQIVVAMLANVASIAFFNFFGISVTKSMSAAHRMVLDSVRTLVIWTVSMALGWESFTFMQLAGFVILLMGTVVYNELLPCFKKSTEMSSLEESLLEEAPPPGQLSINPNAGQ